MEWKIKYHPLAVEELSKLDASVRKIVLTGILSTMISLKKKTGTW